MATANLPADFLQQEWDSHTGLPLTGGFLYTYVNGTTTPQTTYKDANRLATNTNPIVLDADGRYSMWLDPALAYSMKLTRADGSLVGTWDNVAGSALATSVVTSVNGQVGVVSLTAPNISFSTGTSTTWFIGTDVGAALDAIITHVDSGVSAGAVAITDTGGYFTSTNVEGALQEVGARSNHGAFLRQTIFTASGTWTKGADVGSVVIEGVGGGGGSSGTTNGGGGGGGGGYFRKRVATPGATEVVTIGNGGAPNTVGGATAFGTWATANGGGGATGLTAGGIGGTASGGDINLAGNGGGSGGFEAANNHFGHGGGSYFGGGAPAQWNGSTPTAGSPNTGGGGSGGTGGGGAGGSGLLIVTEYS